MQKPHPQHWASVAIGRSGFHLDMFAYVRDKRIGVQLMILNPNSVEKFKSLEDLYKSDSLLNLDSQLEWELREGGKQQQISLRKSSIDPSNRSDWPQQHEFLTQTVDKFFKYFHEKVRSLDFLNYSNNE